MEIDIAEEVIATRMLHQIIILNYGNVLSNVLLKLNELQHNKQ